MTNHYHALIRSSNHPLSEFFKSLHSKYAFYFNRKYHRRGYLFQDRFKSLATQDQFYVEQILRYIHLNPVRGGICKSLDELDTYPWSGHSALMGVHQCSFLDSDTVLGRFGHDNASARQKYRDYLSEGLNTEATDEVVDLARNSNRAMDKKKELGCWVIGDHEFVSRVIKSDNENRARLARYQREGVCLNDVVGEICQNLKVDKNLLKQSCRKGEIADARKVVCYRGYKEYGFSSREIASYLEISPTAVTIAAQKGRLLVEKSRSEENKSM